MEPQLRHARDEPERVGPPVELAQARQLRLAQRVRRCSRAGTPRSAPRAPRRRAPLYDAAIWRERREARRAAPPAAAPRRPRSTAPAGPAQKAYTNGRPVSARPLLAQVERGRASPSKYERGIADQRAPRRPRASIAVERRAASRTYSGSRPSRSRSSTRASADAGAARGVERPRAGRPRAARGGRGAPSAPGPRLRDGDAGHDRVVARARTRSTGSCPRSISPACSRVGDARGQVAHRARSAGRASRPWTERLGVQVRRRRRGGRRRSPLLDDVEDGVALDRPAAGLADQAHQLVHGHGLRRWARPRRGRSSPRSPCRRCRRRRRRGRPGPAAGRS